MIELKGAKVSREIEEQVARAMESRRGPVPKLAVVRVGEKPEDLSYERGALKKMEAFGLRASVFAFPEHIEDGEFKREFAKLNSYPDIHGILVLRPLPPQIDEKGVAEMIDPSRDVDGISPVNLAKVFAGEESGFAPCTAEAVMEVLKSYEIPAEGKRVTIVGRSMVVGRPLAMLMMKANATVTVCHTRTADLKAACKSAEILVASAGKARMLGRDCVGEGAVVIDVGINVDENGALCGDVDLDAIKETASMATPVPGGVGTVTTAVLARHLARAAGYL